MLAVFQLPASITSVVDAPRLVSSLSPARPVPSGRKRRYPDRSKNARPRRASGLRRPCSVSTP